MSRSIVILVTGTQWSRHEPKSRLPNRQNGVQISRNTGKMFTFQNKNISSVNKNINCMDFILLIKHKKTCLIRIKNLNKCDGILAYTKNDNLFLQVHWENQQLNPDEYDSSGLNIFYTKHLRAHDTGILF